MTRGPILDRWSLRGRDVDVRVPWSYDVAVWVAFAAATAVVLLTSGLRIALNGPIRLPPQASRSIPVVETAALLVPAVAAFAIGATSDAPLERVGLVAAGVFGVLAAAVPGARVPAAGAVVTGGLLAVANRLRRPETWREWRAALVSGTLLLGMALSLGGSMGAVPPPARSLGSLFALLGIAATPVFVRPGLGAWATGGLGLAAVLYAGAVAPFVTGAVVLVGAAAVGVPLIVIGLAAGGGVTTVAAGRTGRRRAVFGGLLLLGAGVPATVARSLGVVLGLVLLSSAVGGDLR